MSEDAGDVGITDEGVWVDGFDELEDEWTFVFASEDGNDHDRLSAIPSFAVQDGYTPIDGGVNGGSNLCGFGGEDKELHGLSES